jgi:Domain of unknown function (DUF4388)
MGIAGSLAAFSLAEVFQILNRGRKTGLLTIRSAVAPREQAYHIWLKQGRIMTIAEQRDGKGLLSMLTQRGWLSEQVASQVSQLSHLETPLGLFLKEKGVLRGEQIKLLFHAQVLQRVCALFKVRDGLFQFDDHVLPPSLEMTGLSLSASEAMLLGLRVMKDWSALAHQLPSPDTSLSKSMVTKPTIPLDSVERRVWDIAHETRSLEAIATQLNLSIVQTQQIAFRLIAVGLVEVAAIESTLPPIEVVNPPAEVIAESMTDPPITKSFLKGLVSFLRSKI